MIAMKEKTMTTVYFDYSCDYTNRFQRFLQMADVAADFRPFSLAVTDDNNGGSGVWDRKVRDLPVSVQALVGHEIVRAGGGEGIVTFQKEMFALFGDEGREPDATAAWKLVEKFTGVPRDQLDETAALSLVRRSHESAVMTGVFGTPTVFASDSDRPMFVKMEVIPHDGPAAKRLWRKLPSALPRFPEAVVIEADE